MKRKHRIPVRLMAAFLALAMLLISPSHALSDDEAEIIHTLSDQVQFSGALEAGTQIRVTVYTYLDGRERVLLYQTRMVVGDSGLYALSVPLPLIGNQFVTLELGEEIREYAYLRYPQRLVSQILEYNLNIYEFLTDRKLLEPEADE
ncbi:MAG: hypothetical protein J6P72_11320 [Firmicutes bacterium]|nr:hypothetical protein [Bacillota bacterium]